MPDLHSLLTAWLDRTEGIEADNAALHAEIVAARSPLLQMHAGESNATAERCSILDDRPKLPIL